MSDIVGEEGELAAVISLQTLMPEALGWEIARPEPSGKQGKSCHQQKTLSHKSISELLDVLWHSPSH